MQDKAESMKRLEGQIKRLYPVKADDESKPDPGRNNMASPDTSYIGSMVGPEEGYPDGMRRRVMEPPVGAKMGYHELGDEKEEGDMEWMMGDASQLSGDGSRGSRNWVLAVALPVLMVVAIVCLHQWWWEIKKSASHVADKIGDAFDRRALSLEEVEQQNGEVGGEQQPQQQQQARFTDKAVYSVDLKKTEVI